MTSNMFQHAKGLKVEMEGIKSPVRTFPQFIRFRENIFDTFSSSTIQPIPGTRVGLQSKVP